MPAKPTIVVVDTNCFIRLLFSPLRPVLGATFGGYQLMTLADLVAECGPGTEVAERHAWLLEPDVQAELQKKLPEAARAEEDGHGQPRPPVSVHRQRAAA